MALHALTETLKGLADAFVIMSFLRLGHWDDFDALCTYCAWSDAHLAATVGADAGKKMVESVVKRRILGLVKGYVAKNVALKYTADEFEASIYRVRMKTAGLAVIDVPAVMPTALIERVKAFAPSFAPKAAAPPPPPAKLPRKKKAAAQVGGGGGGGGGEEGGGAARHDITELYCRQLFSEPPPELMIVAFELIFERCTSVAGRRVDSLVGPFWSQVWDIHDAYAALEPHKVFREKALAEFGKALTTAWLEHMRASAFARCSHDEVLMEALTAKRGFEQEEKAGGMWHTLLDALRVEGAGLQGNCSSTIRYRLFLNELLLLWWAFITGTASKDMDPRLADEEQGVARDAPKPPAHVPLSAPDATTVYRIAGALTFMVAKQLEPRESTATMSTEDIAVMMGVLDAVAAVVEEEEEGEGEPDAEDGELDLPEAEDDDEDE